MRKIWFLLCVMVLLSGILPAAADVIWTPLDEYLSYCDYPQESRSYIAAGENGWVEAVDLPDDPSGIRKFPNGTEFPVSAICGEGDERYAWIQKYRNPWEDQYLWPDECFIPMKDLVPGYDAGVFEEMHKEDLEPFTDDFDFCGQASLTVRMTPDSPFVSYEITPGRMDGCREGVDFRNYHRVESVYIDEDGDHWVPIKNVFSRPDGWINISECSVCKLR